MICPRPPRLAVGQLTSEPSGEASAVSPPGADPDLYESGEAYGRSFWLAYVANIILMAAIALLYRYADFVTVLGGSEVHLGWIVGLGMVGSFCTRLTLGSSLDRHGPRLVWLISTAVFVVVWFLHLGIERHDGLAIYVLRIVWCSAVARMLCAATTCVAAGVPLLRVAEMVGVLGTAGFLGMVLGGQLGDLICGAETLLREHVDQMFVAAGLLGCVGMVFVWLATGSEAPRRRRRMPPLTWILRRYHPGALLLIGVASGIGLGLPQTFLRPYAAELNITRIGLFFLVYAPTAIVTRILTRRWFARFGLEPIIILGMAGQVVSVLLFLVVRSQWHLVIPALAYGISHALLYPSVVAAGSRSFPGRYRGLATTLVLAAWDFGLLIGSPIAGVVVHYSEWLGLPPYPTMFITIAGVMAATGSGYVFSAGRSRKAQPRIWPARRMGAEGRPRLAAGRTAWHGLERVPKARVRQPAVRR